MGLYDWEMIARSFEALGSGKAFEIRRYLYEAIPRI
jgi:hypothetical protein